MVSGRRDRDPPRDGASTQNDAQPTHGRRRCGGATAVRWRQTDGGCDDKGGSGAVVGGAVGFTLLWI